MRSQGTHRTASEERAGQKKRNDSNEEDPEAHEQDPRPGMLELPWNYFCLRLTKGVLRSRCPLITDRPAVMTGRRIRRHVATYP
jgi:hypothetical protein